MCANWLCSSRIGLGWAHDAISFAYHIFMHSPYIHTLFSIYLLYLNCFGTFLIVSLFLPLFLFTLVVSMTLKRKSAPSQNPLRSGASSSFDPTLSHIRFSDEDARRTSQRTFLDEVFIRNTESFWWTSPTLTFPLSFIVGDGSHCVTSRSPVHLCWSRSFTPTCMDSIF